MFTRMLTAVALVVTLVLAACSENEAKRAKQVDAQMEQLVRNVSLEDIRAETEKVEKQFAEWFGDQNKVSGMTFLASEKVMRAIIAIKKFAEEYPDDQLMQKYVRAGEAFLYSDILAKEFGARAGIISEGWKKQKVSPQEMIKGVDELRAWRNSREFQNVLLLSWRAADSFEWRQRACGSWNSDPSCRDLRKKFGVVHASYIHAQHIDTIMVSLLLKILESSEISSKS